MPKKLRQGARNWGKITRNLELITFLPISKIIFFKVSTTIYLPLALFCDIKISCFLHDLHKHCCHYIPSKCIWAQIPLQITYKCSSPPAKKGLTQSLPSPNMFHHKLVALVGLVHPKFSKLSALSNYMSWPPNLAHSGGVCRPQNCHFCSETNFSPGMQCFGLKQLVTLCFWGLGSNGALLGQKMAVLGPNRVCKKVDFSQKHHLQICPNRTKGALLSQ